MLAAGLAFVCVILTVRLCVVEASRAGLRRERGSR